MKAASYELVSVLSVRGFRRQLVLEGRKSPRLDSYSHLRLSVIDPEDKTHKQFNGEMSEHEIAELLRILQTLQVSGLIVGARPAWDAEDPPILHAAKLMQYLLTEKKTAEDASGNADSKAEQAPCIASEPPEAP